MYLRGTPPRVVIDISKARLTGKGQGRVERAARAHVGRFGESRARRAFRAIVELAARDPRCGRRLAARAAHRRAGRRAGVRRGARAMPRTRCGAERATRRSKALDARAARAGRRAGRARFARALGDRSMSTEFVFATAQYESGDWDSAPLVPPNIIDTIARYTEIAVAPTGVIVPLGDDRHAAVSAALPHRASAGALHRRRAAQREAVRRARRAAVRRRPQPRHRRHVSQDGHRGDHAARSGRSRELPERSPALFSVLQIRDGPPTTSHELNGWGDNLVHKHLLAVQRSGRIAVLYSSKDYSSEWNYHPESKRFLSVDNTTLRREPRGLCAHRVVASRSAAASPRSRCWAGCSAAASFRRRHPTLERASTSEIASRLDGVDARAARIPRCTAISRRHRTAGSSTGSPRFATAATR